MESKAVAIYSEVGRDEAFSYLQQGSTDTEKAAIVQELANHSEEELVEYLDQIVALLSTTESSEVKGAVCRAVQGAGFVGQMYWHEVTMLLNDPDSDVRYQACCALASMGPNASAAQSSVVALLSDQSEAVRCGACAALGAFEASAHTDQIAALLNDKSPEVQGAACLALGKLGKAGGRSVADVASKTEEPRSRLQAIYALGSMEAEGAKHCDRVVACLSDEDAEIRLTAAQLCGKMAKAVKESGTAWGKLVGLLGDSDGHIRCAAALALGYMGEEAIDMCDSLKDMLVDDFGESGVNAMTAGGCRSRMPPSARKARCAAAAALGLIAETGGEVAVDVYSAEVANLLNEEDWETRMVACEALAMMGEGAREQAAKLSAIFDDEHFSVRAKAARACGKLKDTECASGLADLIADNCPSVREEAMLALAELGDDGSEYIEKVFEKLNDFSPSVRAAAMTALARMGEKGQCYAGAIARCLTEYEAPFVRIAAIEALGNMEEHGAAYADIVADFLEDQLPAVRAAAAASLGKMGPEAEAFSGLIKALADDPSSEVKKAVGKAVLALGL